MPPTKAQMLEAELAQMNDALMTARIMVGTLFMMLRETDVVHEGQQGLYLIIDDEGGVERPLTEMEVGVWGMCAELMKGEGL